MPPADAEFQTEGDEGENSADGNSQSSNYIGFEQHGIKCRKAVEAKEDFALVEYVFDSDGAATVRLDEPLPLGTSANQIFFKKNERGEWSALGRTVRYECDLPADKTVGTVYAVADNEYDEDAASPEEVCEEILNQEPTIRRSEPSSPGGSGDDTTTTVSDAEERSDGTEGDSKQPGTNGDDIETDEEGEGEANRGVTASEAGGSLDMLDESGSGKGERNDSAEDEERSNKDNDGETDDDRRILATDVSAIERRTADGGSTENPFAEIGSEGVSLENLRDEDDEKVTEDGETTVNDDEDDDGGEDNEATSSATSAVDDGGEVGVDLDLDLEEHDSMAATLVAELRNGEVDPEIRDALRATLLTGRDRAGENGTYQDPLARVDERLDEMEAEISDGATVEKQIQEVTQQVNEVEDLMEGVNDDLNEFSRRSEKFADRLKGVEEQTEAAHEAAADAKSETKGVRKRLDETEELLEEMQDLRNRVENMVQAFSGSNENV